MSARLDASTANVGDRLPVIERVVDFAHWNRYAAVNDEFVPIHMDDEAGRAAGHSGAIGMGNLGVSYLHCMLRAWIGSGRIAGLTIQFRSPSRRGVMVRTVGEVVAVSDDESGRVLDVDVWVEDADAVVLTRGTARVELGPAT